MPTAGSRLLEFAQESGQYRIAWNELLFRAHEAGANGILAIRYDVYMLPKGLFGASVTGTAVAIEQLSQLNQALSQDLFGASVTSTAVKVKKAWTTF